MKRLLIATDSFLPRWDGISRFLSEIIPALTQDFYVTVLAPKFEGRPPTIPNIRLVTIPTYAWKIGDYNPPRFDSRLVEQLVTEADIVWTNTIGPIGGLSLQFAKRLGKKSVCYVHSLEWELVPKSLPSTPLIRLSSTFLMKKLAVNLYNKADLIIVPSLDVAKIMSSYGITSKKVVSPIGVPVNIFLPPKNKTQVKSSLGIREDTVVIGFCGRIAREKDLPTLYKAFLKLHDKYENTMLLIVGGGIKAFHSKFAHRSVKFIGSTDNVLPYLQAMDIYVLPSLTETSSLSTMEAMACAVPVIVTPVGSIKYYVKEGFNGLFFPKGNILALVTKLESLVQDPELRITIGRYARETIVKEYSWKKNAKAIARLILDL